jgi:hypothetical protein
VLAVAKPNDETQENPKEEPNTEEQEKKKEQGNRIEIYNNGGIARVF